jgi:hypothetical protein
VFSALLYLTMHFFCGSVQAMAGHGGVPSGAHGHASSRGEAEVAGTLMLVAAPHKSIENKSIEKVRHD